MKVTGILLSKLN